MMGVPDRENLCLLGIGAQSRLAPKSLLMLWRLMKKEKYDIIQTCQSFSAEVGVIFARIMRVPVIVHFEASVRNRFSMAIRMLRTPILSLAHGVIFVSESVKDSLNFAEKSLLRNLTRRVIYNGVSIEEMELKTRESTRKLLNISDDEFVLGYTGRFIPLKKSLDSFASG
jgi:glycosyltransferase involved in cell wall biosynthesis